MDHIKTSDRLLLLSDEELSRRLGHIDAAMTASGLDSLVVCSATNTYYLSGRVFCGFAIYIKQLRRILWMVKRPAQLKGEDVIYLRKPEQILDCMNTLGVTPSVLGNVGLELDEISYNHIQRQATALRLKTWGNADGVLNIARATKTPYEQSLIRQSGISHEHVYCQIPHLYREGMTDIELQIEIERTSRLEGCLGLFRVSGPDMELHMGNILAGDNADSPSPYDFAMGGAGASPSLPVGADGTILRPGLAVMIDVNGNYTGYMTDMTRTFTVGDLPDEALRAHEVSREICRELADMGRPGIAAKDLYERAVAIATDHKLEHYFMGHRQHAGFVGHGVGIVINELPVIAPRSKNILQAGNVIALEPKFVIPHVGAVGIENTYIVQDNGPMQCVTNAPESIGILGDNQWA
ncbi:MAG: aminopeptidase P family protein [Muribaculaceae bacterium]|nr:aminopeptidase P family protein [Muribaculaceae bacterium]